MSSNWCTTLRPANSGFPVNISAKMQPMLHTSMVLVYCGAAGSGLATLTVALHCRRTLVKKQPHSSGARYQRVAT